MSELGLKLATLWSRAGEREEGQGLVEYALILVLVSIVAIGALKALGGSITGILNTIANTLSSP
jgi:pilus assembly protein Flp/PilA